MQRGKYQVSGKGCLHGDVRGFAIAGFADEDDVRVLAQEGAQHASECERDVGIDLNLIDAGKIVLNRIFGSRDIYAGIIDFGKRGIERRGLARTSWPCDIHYAVGLVDQLADQLESRLV